jgi:hypothetical protein
MTIWKTTNAPMTRLQIIRYKQAYIEKGLPIPDPISHDYAIFPKELYKRIDDIKVEKTIDYCFIGQKNSVIEQEISRKWVEDFADRYFGPHSYLQYNREDSSYVSKSIYDYTNKVLGFVPRYYSDYRCTYFDQSYFENMKKSNFCLCPAGDAPWSMRFLDAIVCRSIPIVKEKYETWRSHAESKLDYKFYYADDCEFIYREDWVQHNYDIFMRYHTLAYI